VTESVFVTSEIASSDAGEAAVIDGRSSLYLIIHFILAFPEHICNCMNIEYIILQGLLQWLMDWLLTDQAMLEKSQQMTVGLSDFKLCMYTNNLWLLY
jgi:hypothetical protein